MWPAVCGRMQRYLEVQRCSPPARLWRRRCKSGRELHDKMRVSEPGWICSRGWIRMQNTHKIFIFMCTAASGWMSMHFCCGPVVASRWPVAALQAGLVMESQTSWTCGCSRVGFPCSAYSVARLAPHLRWGAAKELSPITTTVLVVLCCTVKKWTSFSALSKTLYVVWPHILRPASHPSIWIGRIDSQCD